MSFQVQEIRKLFPALQNKVFGKDLVYLDNTATTLKPISVIERMDHFYRYESANVHRGAHELSRKATDAFEQSRETVRLFLNAESSDEIIFTKGTTDSINLVASSFGELLNEGDEIILTEMEHHSNIVPWQMLALRKKLKVKAIPVTERGELDLAAFEKLFSNQTRLVSVVYTSNTLGTINPIEEIIALAKKRNVPVLVDAAQTVSHQAIDVQKLDCDFLAFSGHKIFGPTGIGVLYGKRKLLEEMPPYQGGGAMISHVCFTGTTYNQLPYKFEAGTPAIAEVIGLKTALDFIQDLGFEGIQAHANDLRDQALQRLESIPGLTIYGHSKNRNPIFSFNIEGLHASDVGHLVDREGVAIRAGHHCTQPLWKKLGVSATARASFGIYNTYEDLDRLIYAIGKAREIAL